jgi:glycosyltransferase involved in cell wall biosynthesis
MTPFTERYLLVMGLPYYLDEAGRVWLDRLWHRDLILHLRYLPRLRLAAPRLVKRDEPDLVQLSDADARRLELVPLPPMRSKLEVLRALPRALLTLWRAIGEADTVHSGIAGWPIPLGWFVNPMALLRKRKLVLVIESAFWRPTPGAPRSAARFLRYRLTEVLGRWSINRAHLVIATHRGYLHSLATHPRGITAVTPASWVAEADLLAGEAAARLWQRKLAEPARFGFFGRLIADKGVLVLLEALERLAAADKALRVDLVGQGELAPQCRRAALALPFVRVLDPVPYGEPFYRLAREYHAIIVPSLSDEQPRIIYDAYSQAVPVIAADTEGNRDEVIDGRTGWLFTAGSAAALAQRLLEVSAQTAQLAQLGMNGLQRARQTTHAEMHRKRAALLQLLNAPASRCAVQ